MCLPLIGAAIGAAGSIAGGAMQAQGYRAQAAYQQRQSVMELQRGNYEAARLTDQNNRRLADMRGQYLSMGIGLDGSPLDVIQDSASEASLDEQAVRYGAKVRSDNLAFESKMSRMNAGNAMVGGVLGGIGEMVGGFAQQRAQNQQRTMIRNPYLAYGGGLY